MKTDKFVYSKDIVNYLRDCGELIDFKGSLDVKVYGFSSFSNYKSDTLTFLVPEYNYTSNGTFYKAIITSTKEKYSNDYCLHIRVDDPRKSFFNVIEHFFSMEELDTFITSDSEIYMKQSKISVNAKIGKNVKIGVGCIIEGNVVIGDNTEIHHNVVIRRNTRIGKRCSIFSGTVIGERGFNYTLDKDGKMSMIPHFGGVSIEDDVHIGDNCCIIQGAIDDTIIKRGSKINTMVHIAHNDIIGEDTRITLPCHICGSVIIGERCHIAASMIRNQVRIGSNSVLGMGAVIVKDVGEGETVVGVPAKKK